MSHILDKVLDRINSITSAKIEGEEHVIMNKQGYKPYPITPENFHKIVSVESDNKIAFVDGGNIEILASSNFSLQLVRTYYNIFQDNKKIRAQLFEFFVLVYSVIKSNEIYYDFEIFPVKGSLDLEKVSFSSTDNSICMGNNRATPSKVVEVIRRLLELKTVELLIGMLDNGDIIVLDGSLESKTGQERLILESIYDKSRPLGIIVAGLAKTSRWFTNKGNNLLPLLASISPEWNWYYYPIVNIDDDNYMADVYLVKLHQRSDYVFRLEVHNGPKYNVGILLDLLARNSVDPVFLGYPYGLVDADKFARVSNREKEMIEARLLMKSSKSFKTLKKHLSSINAHNLLDSV